MELQNIAMELEDANIMESTMTELIVTSYEGEYNEREFDDDKYHAVVGTLHGHGVAKVDNGCVYDGTFESGLMHGHGILTWSDGTTYNGDFHLGQVSPLPLIRHS